MNKWEITEQVEVLQECFNKTPITKNSKDPIVIMYFLLSTEEKALLSYSSMEKIQIAKGKLELGKTLIEEIYQE